MILKISDCFIKKFLHNMVHEDDPDKLDFKPTTQADFLRHKSQLYKFYDDLTAKVNDYKFWRLIVRIKQTFKEPHSVIKETKFKEIRSMMKINWHVEIETCELIERAIGELVDQIFSQQTPSDEEI